MGSAAPVGRARRPPTATWSPLWKYDRWRTPGAKYGKFISWTGRKVDEMYVHLTLEESIARTSVFCIVRSWYHRARVFVKRCSEYWLAHRRYGAGQNAPNGGVDVPSSMVWSDRNAGRDP